MPIQPPKKINISTSRPVLKLTPPNPIPQKAAPKEASIPLDTEYSPEFTAAKIPYNLRAAYVAYLQACSIMMSLKEMPFRMEQGQITPEDSRLILEAKARVEEFTDRMARKLKLQS